MWEIDRFVGVVMGEVGNGKSRRVETDERSS